MPSSLVRGLVAVPVAAAFALPAAAGDAFAEIGGFTLRGRYVLIPPEVGGEPLPQSFDPNLPPGFDLFAETDLVANLSNGTDVGDLFDEVTLEAATVKMANGNYGYVGDIRHTYTGTEPLDATHLTLTQHITSEINGGYAFRVQAVSAADPDFAILEIVDGSGTFDGIAPDLGFVYEDVPLDDEFDTIADYPLRAWTNVFPGVVQPDDEFVVTWLYDLGVAWDTFAEDLDVDDGELTVLSPGSGGLNPAVDAIAGFTNTSGTDDATVTVLETSADLEPDLQGFGLYGTSLVVETSLSDGEFSMTLTVPFSDDALGGADPLLLDLAYYDTTTQAWELAVAGNTGPAGTRYMETGTANPQPPVPSFALGDYGVFWNTVTESGYVWANVDHTTEFAVVNFGVKSIGCGYNIDGSLSMIGGSTQLGDTLELLLDDPVGAAPPASSAYLLISLQPDPSAPCGTYLEGFGVWTSEFVTDLAELLVDVLPPNPIATLGPLGWGGSGVGTPVSIPIPDEPVLSGLVLYMQGALLSPEKNLLLGGLEVKLGP